jgi:hypothetical protein
MPSPSFLHAQSPKATSCMAPPLSGDRSPVRPTPHLMDVVKDVQLRLSIRTVGLGLLALTPPTRRSDGGVEIGGGKPGCHNCEGCLVNMRAVL